MRAWPVARSIFERTTSWIIGAALGLRAVGAARGRRFYGDMLTVVRRKLTDDIRLPFSRWERSLSFEPRAGRVSPRHRLWLWLEQLHAH